MLKVDPTKGSDQMLELTQYWVEKDGKPLLSPPPREVILGLKFKAKDKAYNIITKEEVEIIGGGKATFSV